MDNLDKIKLDKEFAHKKFEADGAGNHFVV